MLATASNKNVATGSQKSKSWQAEGIQSSGSGSIWQARGYKGKIKTQTICLQGQPLFKRRFF